MSLLHKAVGELPYKDDVREGLKVRTQAPYNALIDAMADMTDVEVMALYKAMKKIISNETIPHTYQQFAEAINMSLLQRIKQLI